MTGTRELQKWMARVPALMRSRNPPGRAELHFRIGDYAAFRAVMLAALERVTVDPSPNLGAPLRPLARANHDPRSNWMIALIDSWALIGEILTFYQERIINEGYLATAQEDVSIELLSRTLGRRRSGGGNTSTGASSGGSGASPAAAAASKAKSDSSPTPPPATIEPVSRMPMIPTALGPAGPVFPTPGAATAMAAAKADTQSPVLGYQFDPGAAAITDVVFRVVPHQATGGRVLIRAGTAIRSHRADGSTPVVFETAIDLDARLSYNEIAAAQASTILAPQIDVRSSGLMLAGTSTALRPGAQILIVGTRSDGVRSWLFGTVVSVEQNAALGLTLVTWTSPLLDGGLINQSALGQQTLGALEVYSFARTLAPFGHDARPLSAAPMTEQIAESAAGGVSLRASATAPTPPATWPRLLDGLPSRALSALAVGADGSLWIAGEFGVATMPASGRGVWAAADGGLGSADVSVLTVADDGSIWAGSAQGRVYRCQGPGHDWTTIAGGYALVPTTTDNVTQMLPVRADLPRSPIIAVQPHIPKQPSDSASASQTIAAVLVANGVGVYGNKFDGVGWYGINGALRQQAQVSATPVQANVALVDFAVLGPSFPIDDSPSATVPSPPPDPPSRVGYALAASRDGIQAFAWYPFDKIAASTGAPPPPSPTTINPVGPGDTLPSYGSHALAKIIQLVYFYAEPSTDDPPPAELLVLTGDGPRHWSGGAFVACDDGLGGAIPTCAAAVPGAAQIADDGPLAGLLVVASDGAGVWGLRSSDRTWIELPGFSGLATGASGSSQAPDIAVAIAAGPDGQLLASAPLTLRDDWPEFQTITPNGQGRATIDLDAKPFPLAQGSWVVNSDGASVRVFSLLDSEKSYRSDNAYDQPGQVFRLSLDEPLRDPSQPDPDPGNPRSSVVIASSKALDVYEAQQLDTTPVTGTTVELAQIIDGLDEFVGHPSQATQSLRPIAFVGPRVRVCVTMTGGLWARGSGASADWTELGLSNQGVLAVCPAPSTELWVGTEASGISLRTPSGLWVDRSAGLPSDSRPPVTSIACTSTLSFAIVDGALMQWSPTDATWTAVAELTGIPVLSLLAIADELFVGSDGHGLWRRSDDGNFTSINGELGERELRSLAAIPSTGASLLIATDRGVYRYGDAVELLGVGGPGEFQAVATDGRQVVAGSSTRGLWILPTLDHDATWRGAGLRFRAINVISHDGEAAGWTVGTGGAGVYTSIDTLAWTWRPLGAADDIRALARDPETHELLAGAATNVNLVSASGNVTGSLVYTRVLEMTGTSAVLIADELRQGFISATLRDAFDRAKVELAKDAIVEALESDYGRWLLSSRGDPSAAIYLALRDPVRGLLIIEPNTVPILVGVPSEVPGQPGLERVSLADGELEGELLLRPDQWLNRPPLADDEPASEVKRLLAASYDYRSVTTTIELDAALTSVYDRAGLEISANVVRASQGETVNAEVLGSGDGSQVNQKFTLHRAPLTFLPAAPPVYRRSTLSVKVDDIEWTEVATLHGVGPDAQVYAVALDQNGRATVSFGDGQHGARLPTGTHNVVATYRVGLGARGDVDAGTLDILLSPPPGVASVTNPIPATDGVDPEPRESVRRKVPLAATTLDRVVTLADFASFATCYPGVRQAIARQLRVGARPIVQVTVAFDDRIPSSEHGSRCRALDDALAKVAAAPATPSSSAATTFDYFKLTAQLTLAPNSGAAEVAEAVTDALLQRWSPATANIGEPVTPNAVAAIIQAVEGVAGVRVRSLTRASSGSDELQTLTPAPAGRGKRGQITPAVTLVLARDAAESQTVIAPELAVYRDGGVTLLIATGGDA